MSERPGRPLWVVTAGDWEAIARAIATVALNEPAESAEVVVLRADTARRAARLASLVPEPTLTEPAFPAETSRSQLPSDATRAAGAGRRVLLVHPGAASDAPPQVLDLGAGGTISRSVTDAWTTLASEALAPDGPLSIPAFWHLVERLHPADSPLRRHHAALKPPDTPELTPEELLDVAATARRRFSDGRFRDAVGLWQLLLAAEVLLKPSEWTEFGRALQAVSRYDDADLAYRLAARDPRQSGRALSLRAELSWIRHDVGTARRLAAAAAAADPLDRRSRHVLARGDWRAADSSRRDGSSVPRIGHVALYVDPGGNFGDVVVPPALRRAVEREAGDVEWVPIHAHQLFDVDEARAANATLDAIVVGGQGLFLPDTAPNGLSGWQWNVSADALAALRIPLSVWGVGYNLFPGQRMDDAVFDPSVAALVGAARFVGLRNTGSIRALRARLPLELGGRVQFAPCPTTSLGSLFGLPARLSVPRGAPVVLSLAGDRLQARFGTGYAAAVDGLAAWCDAVSARARVVIALHHRADEGFAADVRRRATAPPEVEALYDLPLSAALERYRRAALVVGMRGHAAMIPLGLGTPFLCVSTHPKLDFFLEDIGRREWGVAAKEPGFSRVLVDKTFEALTRPVERRRDVVGISAAMDEVTREVAARFADDAAARLRG